MRCAMIAIFALAIVGCLAWSSSDGGDDSRLSDQLMDRVYRTVLLKAKRSPSMGLSLAEYMASPQGQDNFHFIPSGRK